MNPVAGLVHPSYVENSGERCTLMKLVAIIYSPLQALNLLEYSRRFARRVDVVVVVCVPTQAKSRTQIDSVLSMLSPRKILYRQRWRLYSKNPLGARRAVAVAVAELRACLPTGPHEFVIGEYRSAFSWAVLRQLSALPQGIVVVDDGTAMLRINRRGLLPRSRDRGYEVLRHIIFSAVGVRGVLPPANLKFFSTYSLDGYVGVGDTVIRNDYRNLSAELRALPPDEDSVYVIGSPYREANVVSEGDVELALQLIRFAADSTGKEVIYAAHRRERKEKLEALADEVTVVTPDVPFEILPLVLGKRPQTVVGYYSSLFVTLNELLAGSIEIIALEIPRSNVSDACLSFVDGVYRYYRTELGSVVRVVELPTPPKVSRPPSGEGRSARPT